MLTKSPDIYERLDERWFADHGTAPDPARAAQEWKAWISNARRRKETAKYRKALALAVNVSASSVEHYLRDRSDKLSEETLNAFDTASRALGYDPPKRSEGILSIPTRGSRRIVLLAELSGIPSPRYHLEVIRSIIATGSQHNFSVAIHEISQSDPKMSISVGRIVRNVNPHGVIWFRLTPDDASLEALRAVKILPVVVVAGARRDYPPPVVGHVLPHQDKIRDEVALWAQSLPTQSRRRIVAIATMPSEADGPESIRNERVSLIEAGLKDAGCTPKRLVVSDYSASRAYTVVKEYPDAAGYVCLSDEIAIGIKHLLLIKGQKTARRIIGFDNSSLAAEHGITSISQHLAEIGEKVHNLFTEFFQQQANTSAAWPPYREVPVELELTRRE